MRTTAISAGGPVHSARGTPAGGTAGTAVLLRFSRELCQIPDKRAAMFLFVAEKRHGEILRHGIDLVTQFDAFSKRETNE